MRSCVCQKDATVVTVLKNRNELRYRVCFYSRILGLLDTLIDIVDRYATTQNSCFARTCWAFIKLAFWGCFGKCCSKTWNFCLERSWIKRWIPGWCSRAAPWGASRKGWEKTGALNQPWDAVKGKQHTHWSSLEGERSMGPGGIFRDTWSGRWEPQRCAWLTAQGLWAGDRLIDATMIPAAFSKEMLTRRYAGHPLTTLL